MIDINECLYRKIYEAGDINEHLLYLSKLSKECESILECGVRSVISSWAFLNGLVKNQKDTKCLHLCDLQQDNNTHQIEEACREQTVEYMFHKCSDLHVPNRPYDMVFIDTWHVYGHLKRELELFSKMAQKYIVMHDTEVDKILGETIRVGWDAFEQSKETGIPVDEITKGLQPAIDEFLLSHPEWRVKQHFVHNNGLTVLEKVNVL